MTDTEYIATWLHHCQPCVVYAYFTSSGVQYVLMPLLHEWCDDCGLQH